LVHAHIAHAHNTSRAQASFVLKTPRVDAPEEADKAALDACGPPRGAKDLAALVCVSRRLARELQHDVAAIAKCARARRRLGGTRAGRRRRVARLTPRFRHSRARREEVQRLCRNFSGANVLPAESNSWCVHVLYRAALVTVAAHPETPRARRKFKFSLMAPPAGTTCFGCFPRATMWPSGAPARLHGTCFQEASAHRCAFGSARVG
jgi:hypothetical protein